MIAKLEFTGERYHPEVGGNLFLEHVHRYIFAARFVEDQRVLDIACGEGFGSQILARSARSVIGIDIDTDAVGHADARYGGGQLSFLVGSAASIPLLDASVDAVVSFETIEHIDAHDEMLAEVKRVLRPGGLLIMSTPDKATYSDATGFRNPYHVKELHRGEFIDLIRRHFLHLSLHGQKIGFGSVIAAEEASAPFLETETSHLQSTQGLNAPMYLIAVASDDSEATRSLNAFLAQDIQSSEPVQVRVEFERAQLTQKTASERIQVEKRFEAEQNELRSAFLSDFKWISGQITSLQGKMMWKGSSGFDLVKALITSRVLYGFADFKGFSERRRSKFRRSAEKRDPLLINRRFERFTADCLARISQNRGIREHALQQVAGLGMRVTAIVPNYNHARYLRQRLDSIVAQTYPHVDIIVLDDASTDESRELIASYVERFPQRMRAVFNERNSGNVFLQWQKGHALATGDLIWICESDDFCEPTFLERIVLSFRDQSVMLAFGRIEFVDDAGSYLPGLQEYREQAESGIWENPVVRPAARWFQGGFGVKNVIANVGGCVWRRIPIDDEVWNQALLFRVMGDWFLYAAIAQGGQIAYEPSALAFFRIHGGNTSGALAQSRPEYYAEYARLMSALKRRWPLSDRTVDRFTESCRSVYRAAGVRSPTFESVLPVASLKAVKTETVHVLMGLLGFSYGGGEIFPIHLANALYRQGVMVSVLQMSTEQDHEDVRSMLNPGIPVYRAEAIREGGGKAFIESMGVSIVHSHVASVEALLLGDLEVETPYVATLHGSYEAMEVGKRRVASWERRVDRYVYTADRNLCPFEGLPVAQVKFVKFHNAMPIDERPFEKTRAQLGIPVDAVVFAFVARGIAGKGWEEAIQAYRQLRIRHPGRPMALLAVGEGEFTDKARQQAEGDPTVFFLGYVNQIHGIYRMSDVALVPTRFAGESYPLCLIQAMQVGIPAVATDVGEIRAMLRSEGRVAGLIVDNLPDDIEFVAALADAMERILDAETRRPLAEQSMALGQRYNIDALAKGYAALYRSVIATSPKAGQARIPGGA